MKRQNYWHLKDNHTELEGIHYQNAKLEANLQLSFKGFDKW